MHFWCTSDVLLMYFSKVYTLLIKSVYTFVKSVYTFEKYIRSASKNHTIFLTGFLKSYDILHHIVSKKISSILVGLSFTWECKAFAQRVDQHCMLFNLKLVYPLPEKVMLLHKELISIVCCSNWSWFTGVLGSSTTPSIVLLLRSDLAHGNLFLCHANANKLLHLSFKPFKALWDQSSCKSKQQPISQLCSKLSTTSIWTTYNEAKASCQSKDPKIQEPKSKEP